MKKRLISLVLAISMCVALGAPVFATNKLIGANDDTLIGRSEYPTIETFGEAIFYRGETNDVVYCSQLTEGRNLVFSYAFKDDNVIFQSLPVDVNEVFRIRSGITESVLEQINMAILQNLDMYAIDKVIQLSEVNNTNSRAASIDGIVNSAFGSDYANKFFASRTKTYDRAYQMYCYGTQTTRRMTGANFEFDAGTALTVISTWFALNGASMGISTIITVLSVGYEVANGIKVISHAVKGELHSYECDRVKRVTIPSYSSDVLYSASAVFRSNFILSNGTWTVDSQASHVQPAYDDYDLLFNTAFTRFVNNYLIN